MKKTVAGFVFYTFFYVGCLAQEIIDRSPYVFKENCGWVIYQFANNDSLYKKQVEAHGLDELEVITDISEKAFSVSLKPGLSYELSSYDTPKKLVAISDIEGNFGSFRRLLQATGVIDKNLDWSFGEGHLVLAGDFFDRGNMVTETLWLIYKLEWEAMEAGGHVHFILGNHETMNLYGDLRYVNLKYKRSAELMGMELEEMYGDNSELGQWLRTKNVIEKIGNLLFVHAGVSQDVNETDLTVEQINGKVRNYLDWDPQYLEDDTAILIGYEGVNWYRGYFRSDDSQTVNETLEAFEVDHIVVGHTVVADTISIHYDGRVINIDTKHSEGKSEALLIENGNFYRVNLNGESFPLFPKKGGP